MSEDLEKQLAELHKLREKELLSEETYQATVSRLRTAAGYEAETTSGAVAQDEGATAVASRGVNIGHDAQIVISGDNNSVQAILKQEGMAQLDKESLLREVGNYLTWLRDRTGTIELRGIKREGQQVVQLDLETVYVPLQARVFGDLRSERDLQASTEQNIALNEVLDLGKRLVITGGPGCGKTTVLLHLAYALCRLWATEDDDYGRTHLGLKLPAPLPILVPLSAYAAFLRELPRHVPAREKTLAAFISRYMIEKQTSFDLPADFFAQLLRDGQGVILLLDGLDEVPDEAQRVAVREAIEELVTGREELRVVVTCRSAAYRERSALGKGFREVRVQPLDEEQITPLVRQAYAAVYPHDPARQKEQAQELLAGIELLEAERRRRLGDSAERLVASPLLVRMLLVVHFSERRLPDQRAELYMKATDAMLLPDYAPDEAVADEIGKLVGGSRERHRDLVQHLAFHMHSQGPDQGREISERELRRILSLDTAYQELAADFIALTRLRGTIMEERLGIYRFLHLGFQEFLAARYLATVTALEEGLAGVVRLLQNGPLGDSWWREPILLLAGYLSVTSPQAATRFLRQLAGLEELSGASPTSAHLRWAAAELAGNAAMEWRGVAGEEKEALAQRLADLIAAENDIEAVPPSLRAEAGAVLGRLGDPRSEVTGIDNMRFCAVPKGKFWMGSAEADEDADDSEKPQYELDIPYNYWIGRYPVSNAQYAAFVEDEGYLVASYWPEAIGEEFWQEERGFKGSWDRDFRRGPFDCGPPFIFENHPVVGVSWYESLAFTCWLTDRWHVQGCLPDHLQVTLPSEAQWEKAARGGLQIPVQAAPPAAGQWELPDELIDNPQERRRYPWGDEFDPNLANSSESGIGRTSALGVFEGQQNPYGGQDMSGNVFEWTRSRFGSYPYQAHDGREALENFIKSTAFVLRGGAWASKNKWLRCASRNWINPHYRHYDIGFCLVVSPLPTSEL